MRRLVLAVVLLPTLGLAAGCQAAQPTAAPTRAPAAAPVEEGPAALVVKGKVANELSLTKDAFYALGKVSFQAEHPKRDLQDYEGVMFKTLLDKAQVQSEATEIELTAGDGCTATVSLADLGACQSCALAEQEGGKLAGVFAGMGSNAWVKDVVSIEVK